MSLNTTPLRRTRVPVRDKPLIQRNAQHRCCRRAEKTAPDRAVTPHGQRPRRIAQTTSFASPFLAGRREWHQQVLVRQCRQRCPGRVTWQPPKDSPIWCTPGWCSAASGIHSKRRAPSASACMHFCFRSGSQLGPTRRLPSSPTTAPKQNARRRNAGRCAYGFKRSLTPCERRHRLGAFFGARLWALEAGQAVRATVFGFSAVEHALLDGWRLAKRWNECHAAWLRAA